jgi:hypothetical protein
MATRPASDSDIRYTVMLASLHVRINVRHDRFSRDHFRREPYPPKRDPHGGSPRRGRGRTWTFATPRAGTFARAGK